MKEILIQIDCIDWQKLKNLMNDNNISTIYHDLEGVIHD